MVWKKNFRKLPNHIQQKLEQIDSDELVVGCVKSYSKEDIANGVLLHLDISIADGVLSFPDSVLPPSLQGRHSDWNTNGRVIKRTDLPKETFYIYAQAPNWGNRYSGTHSVTFERERYRRDHVAPRLNEILIECGDNSTNREEYFLKFQLTEFLNRNSEEFDDRLFDCINLLQENTGTCDVVPADANYNDYIQTLNVSWDILPPGTVEEALTRLFRHTIPSEQERDVATDRYTFFNSLNPAGIIYGRSGLQRYFGAKITDDLVVFENIRYGNAIYVMFENWEELSQMSRIDLLTGEQIGFERVVHTGDWESQVRGIIERALDEQ